MKLVDKLRVELEGIKMSIDFVKNRENRYLFPVEIKNKESYYVDLMNIEFSSDGTALATTFLDESVQLIVNAISLFEKGYFDCAYYSLRQSLELSTTIVYLVSLNENEKEIELKKWKNEKQFPMQTEMMKFLHDNGAIFRDLKDNLNVYFKHLDLVKKQINKIVHKQGFNKFYVSVNHPFGIDKSRKKFVDEFEKHLRTCIGAVAVSRLGIDPLPVLLNDKDIFDRTEDFFTSPYSDEFINFYIGQETIGKYKQTKVYENHYNYFIKKEKMQECVVDVIKRSYVNTEKIDDILKQKHLLSHSELGVVLICQLSDKISIVYTNNGSRLHLTDRFQVGKKWSSGNYFSDICNKFKPPLNMPYREAFLTCIVLNQKNILLNIKSHLLMKNLKQLKQYKFFELIFFLFSCFSVNTYDPQIPPTPSHFCGNRNPENNIFCNYTKYKHSKIGFPPARE